MRLGLDGAPDPVAIRLALAACRAPLRVERGDSGGAIVVDAADAAGAAAAFLRAGLVARATPPWPEARPIGHGVLLAEGASWCVGRAPLDAGPQGTAILLLIPVPRDDALRALAHRLRSRWRPPFARRPRSLAMAAARIASGEDGVVAARAYALATGAREADALRALSALRAPRLRAGALDAWHEIASPRGGVWRSLAALEAWWS